MLDKAEKEEEEVDILLEDDVQDVKHLFKKSIIIMHKKSMQRQMQPTEEKSLLVQYIKQILNNLCCNYFSK